MNGMPWKNDAEHIAFLEQQLQFAVTRLREVESMHLMQYKQIERNLEEHHRIRHEAAAKERARLELQIDALITSAQRYKFLREHFVQVGKLALAATGDMLDAEIDKRLPREEPTTAARDQKRREMMKRHGIRDTAGRK